MDIDYTLGDPVAGMSSITVGTVPIIRLFGLTQEGHSVMANIHGFMPYFFIPAPEGFRQNHCTALRIALNKRLDQKAQARDKRQDYVLEVEIEQKESIYGFHAGRKKPFLRITLASPRLVPSCRDIVEMGIFIDGVGDRAFTTYESNIAFVLRFMIDRNIVGADWVALQPGTYNLASKPSSNCQIEVDVPFNLVSSHPPNTEEWQKIAPLRILSFDIECAGRKGVFPEPENDPVIQIANIVTIQGQSKPFIRNIFTVNQCSPIVGTDVRCYKTEAEMLLAWRNFVRACDPDIMTGYNTVNFDTWYLIKRASQLKISEFPFLGRLNDQRSVIKETTFSSKAFGKRDTKEIRISGRVQFDMLMVIQRNYKLRSYTLNSVSAEFLNEQKEDVHHSIISDLFNGSNEDRHRLAVYCLKDAYLPQRLMDKLMCIFDYIEMARVTGVPISYLLTRGQQIKVLSQLYRMAMTEDLLIPALKVNRPKTDDKGQKGYEGAIVISPKTGFYEQPIATLDFSSLYPSIMIAHNLCYSTLINPATISQLSPDSYERSPTGDYFVKSTVKPGILPRILETLLEARARAKAALKNETDPFKKAVLNGRQLALKVSANSVYGFTGATIGKLPCLEISASVTAYGREMILLTQQKVLEKYTVENGYAHDADVIYGDTDSVMVKFGVDSVPEAMKLGREAAQFVTGFFRRPIQLEFEKVYCPYLLINKKRYAGLFWTKPNKYDHMDAKGIETIRRDNCPLVKNVIQTSLDKILIDRDLQGAVDYVKQIISDLLCNKLDVSLLVITKALSRKSDEYTAKQAHVELALRMRKRDPGSAPVVGDRVPYVIVKAAKGARAYEKAEDPLWVLENNIPLDAQYYLHQQLANPLMRIFRPILPNPESLLQGEHTRSMSLPTPTVGGIVRFAQKTLSCIGCKSPLPHGEKTVCKYCKHHEPEIFQEQLGKVQTLEKEFSAAWTQCQRCQGSFHQTVLCTSRDCPIFYMRKKIQKDLDDAHKLVERFDELSW
ncbi:DNA polymerase delta catalytic subunit, variant 2 [Balamuthia mandrillaris]